MAELDTPLPSPEFEEGLEIKSSPSFQVIYGYRDPGDPQAEEQRIFIVPKNKVAEQVLLKFCHQHTITNKKKTDGFSQAVLKGDFTEIINQLNAQAHTDLPSINNLEAQVLQTQVEDDQTSDTSEQKPKETVTQKISRLLTPLQQRAEQAQNSAAEIREKLAQVDPKEVAMSMLNTSKEKLIETIKEYKIEINESFPIGIGVMLLILGTFLGYVSLENIGGASELVGLTDGSLLQDIQAYYQEILTWEPSPQRSGFIYIPIVASSFTLISTLILGANIKIKKK